MSKPLIAFFELESWEKAIVRKHFARDQVRLFSEPLAEVDVDLLRDVTVLSPFIYSQVGYEELDRLSEVRCIATRSTGFDHVDVSTCNARGIVVSNVPSYGENTVAEHTFALILSLSRQIPASVERTQRGNFSIDGLRGFDLQGKTLGVIGTGRIGQHVLRMASGFSMNVLAHDVFEQVELTTQLHFSYVDLPTLLSSSDIISLHVPYSEKTHHLINLDTLPRVKKGALLINTSRGGLVQTEALVKGLQEGIFAGAGLDVLEEEGFLKSSDSLFEQQFAYSDLQTALANHYIIAHPNVIFTAHNAFNSQEAVQRILMTTIENIKAFFEGTPQNVCS